MDLAAVRHLERPDRRLMTLYLLRCLVFPPFSLFALPYFYFRYHSMRYRFDDQGVSMSWGVMFRKEISLSYARIQDIHLTSGLFQRWLGLADIHIQTASGSAKAEMTIEGLREIEIVRDFLYSRMRGTRSGDGSSVALRRGIGGESMPAAGAGTAPRGTAPTGVAGPDLAAALREVTAELRATRLAVERLSGTNAGGRSEGSEGPS